MPRFLALGALVAAVSLAGCETTGTSASATATASGGAVAGTSGLPTASYGNVDPVRGVRYVALDRRSAELVQGVVLSYLRIPGVARFDANAVATEAGHMVLVCGTLSASDGNRTYNAVPYAVFIDYDIVQGGNFLDAASLYGLFSTVARADAQIIQTSPRVIQAYCREMNGAILPDLAAVNPAPAGGNPSATAPLAPRPR